jgi:CoA:oxalate CoA-transferase
LCQLVGAPELIENDRFANPRVQAEHADELIATIEARLAGRPAAEWEAEFVSAGLPASVVRTLSEIIAEPHVVQRGILSEVDVPELARKTTVVGAGFRFEHDPPRFQGAVPRLGEHTHEVLTQYHREGSI